MGASCQARSSCRLEIGLAKLKADLDARMAQLDAHLKAVTEARKMPRSPVPGARQARDGHHHVADPSGPANICW